MITLIFFVLLIAFVGAIVVGTLGDEIDSFLTSIIDTFAHHKHQTSSHKELHKAYYDAIKR